MRAFSRLARYSLTDLARSWWIAAYALFFAATTSTLLYFGEEPAQAVASVLSLVLIVIPLVSVIFGLTHLYGSRDFVELLLAQPVDRRSVFWGQYAGLSLALALAYVVGILGPFFWYGLENAADAGTLAVLLAAGTLLTFTFVGLAALVSVLTDNRMKALGGAVALWLYFAVVYDGLLLIVMILFQSYPLERPLLGLVLLNPLDLARVLVLLRLDVAALMGYTGAVFQSFFGSAWGVALALVSLAGWAAGPAVVAARVYRRKDF